MSLKINSFAASIYFLVAVFFGLSAIAQLGSLEDYSCLRLGAAFAGRDLSCVATPGCHLSISTCYENGIPVQYFYRNFEVELIYDQCVETPGAICFIPNPPRNKPCLNYAVYSNSGCTTFKCNRTNYIPECQ